MSSDHPRLPSSEAADRPGAPCTIELHGTVYPFAGEGHPEWELFWHWVDRQRSAYFRGDLQEEVACLDGETRRAIMRTVLHRVDDDTEESETRVRDEGFRVAGTMDAEVEFYWVGMHAMNPQLTRERFDDLIGELSVTQFRALKTKVHGFW